MDYEEKIKFSEETIKCRSCDKELLSLLLLDFPLPEIKQGKNKIQISSQEIECNCPFCKDKSWLKIVDKKTMISPIDKLYIKNIEQDIIENTLKMSIYLEII